MPFEPFNTSRVAFTALPKFIKIAHMQFHIIPCEIINEDRNTLGWISTNEQVIKVKLELPDAVRAMEIFLHECIHGIHRIYEIKRKDKHERQVYSMATGLTTLFVDNPWLAEWIIACCSKR